MADTSALIGMLAKVLEPLGEHRDMVLSWVEREMAVRPIVTWVEDGEGNAWKLGEVSPVHETARIFAMLDVGGDGGRAVFVFCFDVVEVDGKEGIQFFKQTIHHPRYTHGPVSHHALFAELRALLVPELVCETCGGSGFQPTEDDEDGEQPAPSSAESLNAKAV
jgi:hypothetical protein